MIQQSRNLLTRYPYRGAGIGSAPGLCGDDALVPSIHVSPSLYFARASDSALLGGTLPSILLNSGGSAFYAGGTATSVLEFLYTVGEGDSSEDLDVAVVASDVTATTTILLPVEGAIFDTGLTSPAVVSLPKLGVPGSLGVDSNIVIDTE